jgi:hypothetical protein
MSIDNVTPLRSTEEVIMALIKDIEDTALETPFDDHGDAPDFMDSGYRLPGFKVTPETTEQLQRIVTLLQEVRRALKTVERREAPRFKHFYDETAPGIPA